MTPEEQMNSLLVLHKGDKVEWKVGKKNGTVIEDRGDKVLVYSNQRTIEVKKEKIKKV